MTSHRRVPIYHYGPHTARVGPRTNLGEFMRQHQTCVVRQPGSRHTNGPRTATRSCSAALVGAALPLVLGCHRRGLADLKGGLAASKESGLRFNYFGDLDLNTSMEASRRGSRLREQAQAAKAEGLELLKACIDATGTPKEGLEKCHAS
jgi:hypothetical protein